MKKPMNILMVAATSTLILGSVAHADYADVQDGYVKDAFESADNDWRRITVNRNDVCGSYGKNGTRRIDVLISDYEAIGTALDGGNSSDATKAAKELGKSINRNSRFKSCWRKISRKNGISTSFTSAVSSL
ncbi:hypothetical protein [Hyphococcus lacteus]|uniref:Uncharacterized protein n=1 Tax=Hyphococcus lacteus TaxID=3143536 RepID=A0ABV3Z1R5_9PROT